MDLAGAKLFNKGKPHANFNLSVISRVFRHQAFLVLSMLNIYIQKEMGMVIVMATNHEHITNCMFIQNDLVRLKRSVHRLVHLAPRPQLPRHASKLKDGLFCILFSSVVQS